MGDTASMRIDRLLFYLRLARSRSVAHAMVGRGLIRRNGKRVLRASLCVSRGDVLTLPLGERVVLMRLLTIPERRGPAGEAQSCYEVLDAGDESAIATHGT